MAYNAPNKVFSVPAPYLLRIKVPLFGLDPGQTPFGYGADRNRFLSSTPPADYFLFS